MSKEKENEGQEFSKFLYLATYNNDLQLQEDANFLYFKEHWIEHLILSSKNTSLNAQGKIPGLSDVPNVVNVLPEVVYP